VSVTLRRLLQQLVRRTEQQPVTYHGQVRGRVNWSATMKERHTKGYDPSCYVCREVWRQYDTPENQLIKYLVVQIGECLKRVPATLRNGWCYYPAQADLPTVRGPTALRLRDLEDALKTLRAPLSLRDVSLPPAIEESHLLRAETCRTEEYADAARLYRHYRDLVLLLSWERMVTVGRQVLPLPQRVGVDEEPWIRLGAAILHA
jgi:hypothetical protein